jgi:hypothetical protein
VWEPRDTGHQNKLQEASDVWVAFRMSEFQDKEKREAAASVPVGSHPDWAPWISHPPSATKAWNVLSG